jgi:aryl-alcohol dehydrogenase-like predicted oxidoreductase
MKSRTLGKTGFKVSEIGIGTWQVGGKWGDPFDAKLADGILDQAAELGITFIDTADVYSDGLSEQAVGRALKRHPGVFKFATKCGRKVSPHVSAGYTPAAMRGFVEDSLKRLNVETLDLVQLHCPPTEVFYRPEIFETFDKLKQEGKVQNLGVSVEKVEEGLKSLEYANVASIQVIFNLFRTRPAELLFEQAKRKNVGIIVRVPLASGLLSGKMSASTSFGKEDHRTFNRDGAAFDKGETFSGVDFATGLKAVDELKGVFGPDLAAWALRWILSFDAVSTVIPGASRPDQVASNVAAAKLPAPNGKQRQAAAAIYDKYIRHPVHQLW